MRTSSQFATITTEGGLLPSDLITRLANDTRSLPGTREEDYHLIPGRQLREIINRSWNDLLGAWQVFQPQVARLAPDDHTATITWERWLLPLFAELGYGRLQRLPGAIMVDDKEYPVSHRHDEALIHLVGWNVALDRRTAGVVGAAKASPHSMVQELLNRTDDHLWAVVSNGRQLRVIRDNSSLTRAAYVEFDLETMFTDGVFADFATLWLLVHASRLEGDPQSGCWLETWANEVRQQGVRALDALGQGFVEAIEALGQGFLAHPANMPLRQRLRDGELTKQDYYRQLLRVVYRLVFLLVAEDRSLLHPPDASAPAKERYDRYYSLSRVRDLARGRRGTKHSDLWDQIVIVAKSLGPAGEPTLGLPALNSGLWGANGTVDLDTARLANTYLLTAMRSIAYTRKDQALHRIDYRNLGTEELGSVYESLLELQPSLEPIAATFSLQHASGNERKTTGSYYTPTSLISTLLDASLDRLLDEAEMKPDPEQALLDLKVIDPACGSGHFLVAAAQRIARRLAAVRTGETDPAPSVVRRALREVIGRCVYGIDRNPMAVELCKVSLWLESVEPGKPLSFLDHHIVCGNGLLGATPRLLDRGVPDEAFVAIEGDDKPTAAARKKANANERSHRTHGLLGLVFDSGALAAPISTEMAAIEALPSDTPSQVAELTARYQRLQESGELEKARLAADAWCAAFVAIKAPAYPAIRDATVRMLVENPDGVPAPVLTEIADLARQYGFLHWHLAFPQVLQVDLASATHTGCTGGFDLITGNPPWDSMGTDQREFFAAFDPTIASMSNEEQDQTIEILIADPAIEQLWSRHRRETFASTHFCKTSGVFTLFAKGNLAKGDFNTYRLFVEQALRQTRPGGYVGQIVQSSLLGGANATAIRKYLLNECDVDTILAFDNTRRSWFDVGLKFFAAYTARVGGTTVTYQASFGILTEAGLTAAKRHVLRAEDVRLQSPETYAIPELADDEELAISRKMFQTFPRFGDEIDGLPMRSYSQEFNLTSKNALLNRSGSGVPAYEGKMIDAFDHRAKNWLS